MNLLPFWEKKKRRKKTVNVASHKLTKFASEIAKGESGN